VDIDALRTALDQRARGRSLPQALYASPAVFEAELEGVFAREWLFACNACEIRSPGDYLTLDIGRDSVMVVRGHDLEIRAFHNTCRHRGSRICLAERGNARRLVCPYHQWTYELDGRLFRARQMPPDFDAAEHGLRPVHVEVIGGLVLVSIAAEPPSLRKFRAAVSPYITPHAPQKTKIAHVSELVEQANWKLVIENNRECYHCAGTHPELMATLVDFALPADAASDPAHQALMQTSATRWQAASLPYLPADGGTEFRCIRLPFKDGRVSFTPDGSPACRRLLGGFSEPDQGSVRMFRVPNSWHHFLSDHIIHCRVMPQDAASTVLRTTWLVHEDAVEGVDYGVENLTAVWKATNEQDRRLAENNQRGVLSRAYVPGPYNPSEFMLTDFNDWYIEKMNAAYPPPSVAAALSR